MLYWNQAFLNQTKNIFFLELHFENWTLNTFTITRYPKNILGLKIKSVDSPFKESYDRIL